MHLLSGRTLLLLTALAALGIQPAGAAAGKSAARQHAAIVQQLVASVNGHKLAATTKLFGSSAVLQIENQQLRGRAALQTWWRGEFAHKVHLSFKSSIQSKGNQANAVISRTTNGGDCSKSCVERAIWQIAGSHFARMTLSALTRAVPPSGVPSVTPPPIPQGTPSPHVTPTIPT